MHLSRALVERLLGGKIVLQQLGGAIELDLGELKLGLGLGELGLGGLEGDLVGARLDDEKEVPFLHDLAIGEIDGFEIAADAGPDLDGLPRLELTGEVAPFLELLDQGLGHGDRGRRRSGGGCGLLGALRGDHVAIGNRRDGNDGERDQQNPAAALRGRRRCLARRLGRRGRRRFGSRRLRFTRLRLFRRGFGLDVLVGRRALRGTISLLHHVGHLKLRASGPTRSGRPAARHCAFCKERYPIRIGEHRGNDRMPHQLRLENGHCHGVLPMLTSICPSGPTRYEPFGLRLTCPNLTKALCSMPSFSPRGAGQYRNPLCSPDVRVFSRPPWPSCACLDAGTKRPCRWRPGPGRALHCRHRSRRFCPPSCSLAPRAGPTAPSPSRPRVSRSRLSPPASITPAGSTCCRTATCWWPRPMPRRSPRSSAASWAG